MGDTIMALALTAILIAVAIIERLKMQTDYSDEFKEFWARYPRPVNKKGAWRCWQTRLKNGAQPADMVKAAHNYALARKGEPENFTLHPSTFLGPDERYAEWIEGGPDGKGHTKARGFGERDYTNDPTLGAFRGKSSGTHDTEG